MDSASDKIMAELKEDAKKLNFFGTRHTLALLCFVGYMIVFGMRVSLSVSIVSMTSSTKLNHSEAHFNDVCPYPSDYHEENDSTNGEFNWSEPTKGLVLGSYYYGYVFMNCIGGRAADYFGGRYVNGLGVIMASICMVASPAAVRHSITLFMVLLILQGVAAGASFPALTTLITKWYPRNERSTFSAFILSANQLGTVVSMAVAGWLCGSESLGGWPSVFYVLGCLGLIWGVFWFLLTTEDPSSHPRISDKELKYIMKGCPPLTEQIPVPWRSLFSSKYYWCTVSGHFAIGWSTLTLLTELPTYLDNIHHVKIEHNGILSSLPFLGAFIFSTVLSLCLNTLVVKKVITLLSMRKISMVFAGYFPALGAIILCFTNCDKVIAIAMFIVVGTTLGGQYPGVFNSYADITPRFAGTAIGIANTIGCIPGFLSPMIVSYLTDGNQTISAWNIVFVILAVISLVCTTVYIIWITTEIQPWNDPQEKATSETKTSKDDKLCVSKKTGFVNENANIQS